jgi:membrane protein required for colicin V production
MLVLIGFGAYQGYKKGLILEIIGLLAFLLAIIGGFKLLHWGVQILNQYMESYSQFVPFIAFILIFIGILILVNILGKLLKKVIDMTIIGSFDNLGGALLGIAKWSFGLSVVLLIFETLNVQFVAEQSSDSFMYPIIAPVAPAVFDFFNDYFPFLKQLFETLKEKVVS